MSRIKLVILGVVLVPSFGMAVETEANVVVEIPLRAGKAYSNPFQEVTLDVVFTDPGGAKKTVPAFWAGRNEWKVRYASPVVGAHTYRSICSDSDDAGLHAIEGRVEIKPYTGNNPLYRHGPIQVAADRRHFEHADGTPFFWLGDTWWKGLAGRLTWEGFQKLTADRKAKGFTVVHIIGGGPFPDEPLFDERWKNEGGWPYTRDFVSVNPEYFQYADRRFQHLVDAGIVPVIVGAWGWHRPGMVPNDKIDAGEGKWFYRHWRYLIARYGAYPVVWITAGEMRHPYLEKVAKYVRETDPYGRLLSMHAPGIPQVQSGRKALNNDAYCDFDFMQTAHNDWHSAPITVSSLTAALTKTPTMPVVNSEVVYEWHKDQGRHDIQRYMFWVCMLSGAAGHSYGAGGIWQMNTPEVHGSDMYETIPWFVAMHYPGGAQIARGKKLLEEYDWWRFEPHLEWVEPHSSAHTEPSAEWYDNHQKWAEMNGRADLPFAAGIPGEARFIYIPGKATYDLKAPVVRHLEPDVDYRAYLFEPMWGGRIDLGKVKKTPSGQTMEYQPPQLPSPQDWVLVMEKVGSKKDSAKICSDNMAHSIALWPDRLTEAEDDLKTVNDKGHVFHVSVPRLVPFLPPSGQANGTAIIICPGGGYRLIDWVDHVERLAQRFNPKGIAIIGLRYRTAPPSKNIPGDALADLRRALRIVYANADKWNIDPDRLVGLGFSAGANLLLHYACTEDLSLNKDELHQGATKLGYMALLCLWPYNKPVDAYAIRPDAPSAFLCASEEDKTAPATFSQAISDNIRRVGRDVELKIYPKGNHLAFQVTEAGPEIDWISDFLTWLANKGLLDSAELQ